MTGPLDGGAPSEPRRVLLVEDDASLIDAYRMVLEPRGLEVVGATTASEALSRLEEARPKAIVADLRLPDAHGPELLLALRTAAPEIPLLVLTGREPDRARDAGEEIDVAGYMTKPVSGAELAARIDELLRSSPG